MANLGSFLGALKKSRRTADKRGVIPLMSQVDNKNHYELLGLKRDATVEQVKNAYKEIARVYHPDSNFYSEIIADSVNNESVDIFKQITAAYTVLSNASLRAEYDASLPKDLPSWVPGEVSPKPDVARTSGTYVRQTPFGNTRREQKSAFDSIFVEEPPSVADILRRSRMKWLNILLPVALALVLGACMSLAALKVLGFI